MPPAARRGDRKRPLFNAKLNNPENDARLVGVTLRGLPFEVTGHVKLPVRRFRQVLRDYVGTLQSTDAAALLYYAGHGESSARRCEG